jgi:hypothetical protein
MKRKELNMRHNAVLNALYLYTSRAGGVAVKEPTDLNDKDGRRPDLQLLLPGLHYLADVRITHPLCPTHVQAAANKQLGAALRAEREKTNRYQQTAEQHHAEFIPFVVETLGGIAPAAVKLLDQIALTCRDHMTLWSHQEVVKELRGAIAIAVQRGNAIAMIAGYNRAVGRAGSVHTSSAA